MHKGWVSRKGDSEYDFYWRVGRGLVGQAELIEKMVTKSVEETGASKVNVYVTINAPSGGGANVTVKLPDRRSLWRKLFKTEEN